MSVNDIIKDEKLLHPKVFEKLQLLKKELDKLNIQYNISETYRSPERQDFLKKTGKSNASQFSSYHQLCLAFDIYPLTIDRKKIDESQYNKIGEIGVKIGLEWGGNWKSIVDKPHFQLKLYNIEQFKNGTAAKEDKFFVKLYNDYLKSK